MFFLGVVGVGVRVGGVLGLGMFGFVEEFLEFLLPADYFAHEFGIVEFLIAGRFLKQQKKPILNRILIPASNKPRHPRPLPPMLQKPQNQRIILLISPKPPT